MIQPLEDDAIAKSARHSSLKNATLYYGKCMMHWVECGIHNQKLWQRHRVSAFMSIFLGEEGDVRENSDWETRIDMDVPCLARWVPET